MWAALDCPSGLPWIRQDPDMPAGVLGKMAASIHRTPSPGERVVVPGWTEAPISDRGQTAAPSIHHRTMAVMPGCWVGSTVSRATPLRTNVTEVGSNEVHHPRPTRPPRSHPRGVRMAGPRLQLPVSILRRRTAVAIRSAQPPPGRRRSPRVPPPWTRAGRRSRSPHRHLTRRRSRVRT